MTRVGNIAADQLKSVIARIESLEEQKADIKEIYAVAKGSGFVPAAIRQIIKLRKMDTNERDEQEAILTTYMRVLGMAPELDEEHA